jgi:hypothetical protein
MGYALALGPLPLRLLSLLFLSQGLGQPLALRSI